MTDAETCTRMADTLVRLAKANPRDVVVPGLLYAAGLLEREAESSNGARAPRWAAARQGVEIVGRAPLT